MDLLNVILDGLARGSLYALLALPLTLVYLSTEVLDVNIGGYVVVAGMVATMGGALGIVLGIAAAIALGAVTALLFLAFHKLWQHADHMVIVLATFGLAMATQSLVQVIYGTDTRLLTGVSGYLAIGDFRVSHQALSNIAISAVMAAALGLLLQKTLYGLRMRASAISRESAALVGTPVRALQVVVIVATAAISGVVGVLLGMTVGLAFSSVLPLSILALTAAVIFGLRSPARALMGGLFLGVVQSIAVAYLPDRTSTILPALLMILVLTSDRFNVLSVKQMRA